MPSKPLPFSGPFLPIVFFTAFAFFYLFLPPLFADSDTPWHIATGALILERGSVPLEESWSFTAPEHFWLNYSWGWDLLIALIHRAFGLEGLFLFSTLWMAGIVTLLGFVLLKRGGASQDPVMITLALAAMVLLTNMGARPQSFSYLAALLVHAMLHWNRTDKEPQRILWMFPLFMALWVNMHSGFIFGFIVLGAYGLEAMMKKDWERFRMLVGTGALGAAAIHATPLFPALGWDYLPAIYHSLVADVNQHIKEWLPYRFQQYAGFDVLLLALLLSANFSDRKVPVADRILTAAWIVASLASVRNFALLAIISAPLLALRLESALLHKSDSPLLKPGREKLSWAAAMIACALLAVSPARKLFTGNDTVLDKEMTPHAALAFMREHYPDLRFFNSWTFGGYMIYYNRDTHKVAMDGRGITAYPEDVLRVYLDFINNRPVDAQMAQWGVEGLFLFNAESRLAISNLDRDPAWKLVYRDKIASVYVKRELGETIGEITPLQVDQP